jgi:isopentenyl-diphosphate delta-isomerase type 1
VNEELLQLVDEQGRPIGSAPRAACHGNPELIQAVVHLYLFDLRGRLYLQKRSRNKDTCPGLWDSSMGGHLGAGESAAQALEREIREELGLSLSELRELRPLPCYLTRTDWESEYVFPCRAVFDGQPRPNPEEIEEGRFEPLEAIRRRIAERPEEFTPHFRIAFARLN